MNYQFKSDNMDISESMKELAKEKISKLEHRFKNVDEGSKYARVVMNKAPVEQFAVRIDLDIDGEEFFTDETNYSLETALVLAVEELERKVNKSKYGAAASSDWEERREAKRFNPDDEEN